MTQETAEAKTSASAPKTSASAPKTASMKPRSLSQVVGSRNPDNEAILKEIEGQEVELASVEIEERQGKRRKYHVTTVTLTDGRTFSVVGNGVAKPLGYLEPEDFPILACFKQEPSDFEPGAYYWIVE